MWHEFFSKSPVLFLPVGALVAFIALFAVQVVWAFMHKKSELEGLARIPLDSEENHES